MNKIGIDFTILDGVQLRENREATRRELISQGGLHSGRNKEEKEVGVVGRMWAYRRIHGVYTPILSICEHWIATIRDAYVNFPASSCQSSV